MTLFERLLLPLADVSDARTTCRAIEPYLSETTTLGVVHVTPDETASEEIFETVREAFPDHTIETDSRRGEDVTAEVASAVESFDATAIGLVPRPKNIILSLLSRSATTRLIAGTDVPVVVFPEPDDSTPTRKHVHSVLVALDDESQADETVEQACLLFPDETLIVAFAPESPPTDPYTSMTAGTSSAYERFSDRQQGIIDQVFERAIEIGDDHGISVETAVLVDTDAAAATTVAHTHGVSLVVVGHEDDDERDRRVLGSLATDLVRSSPIPVVIP